MMTSTTTTNPFAGGEEDSYFVERRPQGRRSHDRVSAPRNRGYVINVASAKNGVGYGSWTHIDGWSESVIDYIREIEFAV